MLPCVPQTFAAITKKCSLCLKKHQPCFPLNSSVKAASEPHSDSPCLEELCLRAKQRWDRLCMPWNAALAGYLSVFAIRCWVLHTSRGAWDSLHWPNVPFFDLRQETSDRDQLRLTLLSDERRDGGIGVVFTPPSPTRESLLLVRDIFQNKFWKVHSPLLPSCRWPPWLGRWRPRSRRWPLYSHCTWIDRPCNKLHRALYQTYFCCGMICVRIFVSMDLLPLALLDLKIGSNGGIELVSSSSAFWFASRNFFNAAEKSAHDRICPAFLWLLKTHRPHLFVSFPFLPSGNVWVVFFCEIVQGAVEILQSIRCSSASFDRFHTSESDEGLIGIFSCAPLSSILVHGSMLVGP